MSSPFHRELQSNIADAQRRPVPLKFAPPVGGFGDPEPAIYSHPNNLDHAAVARKQARDKPKTPTS